MGTRQLPKVSTRSAAVNCIPDLCFPINANLYLFHKYQANRIS